MRLIAEVSVVGAERVPAALVEPAGPVGGGLPAVGLLAVGPGDDGVGAAEERLGVGAALVDDGVPPAEELTETLSNSPLAWNVCMAIRPLLAMVSVAEATCVP